MKLATIRTAQGTRAVRVDGAVGVFCSRSTNSILASSKSWRSLATLRAFFRRTTHRWVAFAKCPSAMTAT